MSAKKTRAPRAERVSIDEIRQDPDRLEFASNPAETLGELLEEITVLTGMSYRELGERIGLSATYVGRLVRGAQHEPSPDVRYNVADLTGLSFERINRATTLGALDERRRQDLLAGGEAAAGGEQVHRHQSRFYRDLCIRAEAFDDVARTGDLRHYIEDEAKVFEHVRPLPPVGPDSIFVQMTDDRMCYRPGPGEAFNPPWTPQIPPGAFVEVELIDAQDPVEDGTVVLVQFDDDPATFFWFEAQRSDAGRTETEIYHRLDRERGRTRVVRADRRRRRFDPDRRRRVLGRARRVITECPEEDDVI